MNNSKEIQQDNNSNYAKILSSLFCSVSILGLSILCLLNNLSLDFYSMVILLKVVVPASFCFWFLGFVIGRILDSFHGKVEKRIQESDNKAYELPSMFNAADSLSIENDSELGIL